MLPRITLILVLLFGTQGAYPQAQDKSIWFSQKKYTDHSLVRFGTIRSRSLPFITDLSQFAPLPQDQPDSLEAGAWLLGYYAQTIQDAYATQNPDRAYLTDSVSHHFDLPEKAYRLFTSRTRRYDKIKYIRYAISKGLPVMAGFAQHPTNISGQQGNTWDGQGKEQPFRLLIVGYDSPTASFQLLGNQGYIWMTARDLLATAAEILCLQNPTTVKRPESSTTLERPIQISMMVQVKKLRQSEDKAAQLQTVKPQFDTARGLYHFDTPAQPEDRYQLSLSIPKGRCTYLFVAQSDGTTTPAWRLEYNVQDTTVTLPPVSYYQFPDSGQHHFFLLSSFQPIPRWRRYVDRFEFDEAPRAPQEKLYRAFERFLLPFGKIKYQENIGAHSEIKEHSGPYVVPIIIEWEVRD